MMGGFLIPTAVNFVFLPVISNMSNINIVTMKKMILVLFALTSTLTASAQFITYEPLYGGSQPSYTRRSTYDPFLVYEPLITDRSGRVIQQQEESRSYTVTGYYEDRDQWHTVPCRLIIVGEQVKNVSYKTSHGWFNATGKFNEVTRTDPEVVRDNFNYKVWTTTYGTIYF